MSLTVDEIMTKFLQEGTKMLTDGENPDFIASGMVQAAAAMSAVLDHATGQSHQVTVEFFAAALHRSCQESKRSGTDTTSPDDSENKAHN